MLPPSLAVRLRAAPPDTVIVTETKNQTTEQQTEETTVAAIAGVDGDESPSFPRHGSPL
jgi:hypothetical protein